MSSTGSYRMLVGERPVIAQHSQTTRYLQPWPLVIAARISHAAYTSNQNCFYEHIRRLEAAFFSISMLAAVIIGSAALPRS